jgi:ribosome-associated protein
MILLEDTRQQAQKHDIKHQWFEKNGITIRRQALYCGDYTLPTDQSVCIDTKKDIQELVGDICGKQHERFRNECIRAQEAGIRLIILTENIGCKVGHGEIYNPTITKLEELHRWKNPRLFIFDNGRQKYPRATRGVTLQKACMTLKARYGVEFLFCTPMQSAAKIVELLTGETHG